MFNKKLLTSSGLCLLFSVNALSQGHTLGGGNTDSKLNASQGSGASIGSIFSPSLYNGTANISIPIFDYGAYGISLNYNTLGVKVDELAGSVGLHWDLNAAGSITRQIKDMPDEVNLNTHFVNYPGGGTAGGATSPYNAGVKGKFVQFFGAAPASENADRYIDGESDDFIFSVGGLSFTFNIGANGAGPVVFTHPQTYAKVEIMWDGVVTNIMPIITNSADYTPQKLSFKVTDVQGNQYFFTPGEVSLMEFRDGLRVNSVDELAASLSYVSNWLIQKIIKSDGSEIVYNYETDYVVPDVKYNSITSIEEASKTPSVTVSPVSYSNVLISTKHLTSIFYPNSVNASFVYRDANRYDNKSIPILQEIKISSDDNCVRYSMQQAYAMALGVSGAPERPLPTAGTYVEMPGQFYCRLILKGIERLSCDGNTKEPYYSFDYQGTLPPRNSGSQDYFGYYNGKTIPGSETQGGQLSVPYHVPLFGNSTVAYGAYKDYDGTKAAAGLLWHVKNAYGSTLTMYYEPNQFNNITAGVFANLPTNASFLGQDAIDGVRIKKMVTTDKYYLGRFIQQVFEYSGGQRFLTGGYFNYPLWPGNDNTMFCSSYISPHQLVNGANHGYSNVTITTQNETNQLLSKKELTYSNFYDATGKGLSYYTVGKNYFEAPYTDKQYIKDWELGLLLSSKEYDQNGNILTSTVNTYDFTKPIIISDSGVLGTSKTLNVVDNNGAFVSIASDKYRHFTGFAPLVKTVTQKYVSNTSFINDEASYTYDSRNNIKTTITKDSRGVYSLMSNTYNYDIPVSTPGDDLSQMNTRNLHKLISTLRWKMAGSAPSNQDLLLDASITKYRFDGNKLLNQKQYTLQSLDPIPFTSYYTATAPYGPVTNAYSSNTASIPNFVSASEVIQTNGKGHATEMKYMGQNIYSALIWDINENIAATVSNARLADVGFTSFESDIYNDPTSYTGNAEVTNGRFSYKKSGLGYIGSKVSGKTFYKLGPASFIKTPALTSGQSYVLTFWSNGGVPTISGAGTTLQPEMQYELGNGWKFYKTVFTASTAGVVSFSSATLINIDEVRLFPSDGTMTSTVYIPLFGASSTTDATGRITYYEYDALGHQVVTKDQEGNVLSKTETHIGQ